MGDVTDLQKQRGRSTGRRGGGHDRLPGGAPGKPQPEEREGSPTEGEEKLRMEREAKELAKAQEQLALPIGGTPASKFYLALVGYEQELPPAKAGKFQRDEEVEVKVRGWIKQGKETTEKKGGVARRTAVLVIEELVV